MWDCPKCNEAIEDEFDVCWNCGTSRDGVEDPNFETSDPRTAEEIKAAIPTGDPEENKEIEELRYRLKRIRSLLKVLSFLSVLMALGMTLMALCAWLSYLVRQDQMNPLYEMLSTRISLVEVLQFSAASLAAAFFLYASFLWSYSMGISDILNADSISLSAILSLQSRFWRRVATTSEIAAVGAIIIVIIALWN